MAGGGDAPDVPAWDLAVLIGAALVISTLVIAVWTQPTPVSSENLPTEVMTFHTGLSDATVSFEAGYAASCWEEGSDPCEAIVVTLVSHNGDDAWDGIIPVDSPSMTLLDGEKGEMSTVSFNEKIPQGEYRVILEGDADLQLEMTINRSIPHEYVPALFGSLLLTWGIWRKAQEMD